ESLFAATGTALLWARIFYIYGSEQRRTSLIPSAFRSLQEGKQPDVRTPEAVQDFIHVDDVARGLAAIAISKAPPGVYNLGSGQRTRVGDLVELIAGLLTERGGEGEKGRRGEGEKGRRGEGETDAVSPSFPPSPLLPFDRVPGSPPGFWASIDKILQHTDWK